MTQRHKRHEGNKLAEDRPSAPEDVPQYGVMASSFPWNLSGFMLLLVFFTVAMSVYKYPILFECIEQFKGYMIFPWQGSSAMPAFNTPAWLLFHLTLSLLLTPLACAVVALAPTVEHVKPRGYLVFFRDLVHAFWSIHLFPRLNHLGTRSELNAIIFNGIPFVIMQVAVFLSFYGHVSGSKRLTFWADRVYLLALMSAVLFEVGYRIAFEAGLL